MRMEVYWVGMEYMGVEDRGLGSFGWRFRERGRRFSAL